MNKLIPVTILTGFLGSGKTTLLNRILQEDHGYKIAVIENEFGEEGIDNDLLINQSGEQIIEMNNGCICCTVRGDLIRILGELNNKRLAGKLNFQKVFIETTGLADPAPVAQTFFMDDDISDHYMLDAIITLVDAKHADMQLDDHHEAKEQVAFADRIFISKTDLVDDAAVTTLRQRLMRINPRASIKAVHFGNVALTDVFDIKGFNLNAILDIEPDFLNDVSHEHDDDISSFVYRQTVPLDLTKTELFIDNIVQVYGTQLLRYKGIFNFENIEKRIVFQGVHMLLGSDIGRSWGKNEMRETKMVFIGKNLPKEVIIEGLNQCTVC